MRRDYCSEIVAVMAMSFAGDTEITCALRSSLTSARDIAGADTGSLHYPLQSPLTPNVNRYMHEVWAGKSPPQTFRPRVGGLGERAIRAGEPQFLRYTGQADVSETVTFNPKVSRCRHQILGRIPADRRKGPVEDKRGCLVRRSQG